MPPKLSTFDWVSFTNTCAKIARERLLELRISDAPAADIAAAEADLLRKECEYARAIAAHARTVFAATAALAAG